MYDNIEDNDPKIGSIFSSKFYLIHLYFSFVIYQTSINLNAKWNDNSIGFSQGFWGLKFAYFNYQLKNMIYDIIRHMSAVDGCICIVQMGIALA